MNGLELGHVNGLLRPSIELHRIPRKRRQRRLQGFAIGHAGGLQHGGLGGQALQIGIDNINSSLAPIGPHGLPR